MWNRIIALSLLVVATLAFTSPSFARSVPDSFADLVDTLSPSVVNISSTQEAGSSSMFRGFSDEDFPHESLPEPFRDFFERFAQPDGNGSPESKQKAISLGSGFIIDTKGHIVTNNHVIKNAEEIKVTFSDGDSAIASVVGKDSKTDLALLKINTDKKLKPVTFGNSDDSRVGDWVIAIGNPYNLGGSVSAGIISARARDINAGPFDDFIQTDAAINKGNSGGPLFNLKGEVIGINTAIVSPSGGNIGIGFAVPSILAQPVLKQLQEHGRTYRGWLGVKIREVTEELAGSVGLKEAKGAFVEEVIKESPAAKAEILAGDIILEFDGKDIDKMRQLPRIVAETKIGKKVKVKLFRNGDIEKVNVTLGELKEEEPELSAIPSQGKNESNIDSLPSALGMSLTPLTDGLKSQYRIDTSVSGLLVMKVDADSAAAKKGITKGDIIVSANQHTLKDVGDLEKQIKNARKEKREFILLLVNRRGETQFMPVALGDK